MTLRSRLGSVIATVSLAVVTAGVTAVVLRRLEPDDDDSGTVPGDTDASSLATDAAITEEKLRAYREIMREIVALNREAVALDPEQFRHEADAIAFDRESALEEQYLEVNETYESYLYVIDESVREAASDYVGYLATYHDEGSHAGALLYRAGEVYEAMRADLGLESLFDEGSADPPNVGTNDNVVPDFDGDPPEIDDFSETLGSAEDLEYFNADQRHSDEDTDSVDDGTSGDSDPTDDDPTDTDSARS